MPKKYMCRHLNKRPVICDLLPTPLGCWPLVGAGCRYGYCQHGYIPIQQSYHRIPANAFPKMRGLDNLFEFRPSERYVSFACISSDLPMFWARSYKLRGAAGAEHVQVGTVWLGIRWPCLQARLDAYGFRHGSRFRCPPEQQVTVCGVHPTCTTAQSDPSH